MRMTGIPEKMLGESTVPTDPTAICLLCSPPQLPMCLSGASLLLPKLLLSTSASACPSYPQAFLALVPTSTPRTRAWFLLPFSPPERWPQAKTWSGIEMHAGLCPIPLALGRPLLEYWPSMRWALMQMSEAVTPSELSVEPSWSACLIPST